MATEPTYCLFKQFTLPFSINMMRLVCYTIYMQYISRRCFFYFPLPFAWIFRDFNKFIFEPYCIRVFESYLYEREPASKPFLIRTHLLREDHGVLPRRVRRPHHRYR